MPTRTHRNRDLLAAARAGDADAYGALVGPYRSELHAHCRRILGSGHDADDAVQDALLRAWRSLGTYERRAPLRAWLFRIATNCAFDVLRRRASAVVAVEAVAREARRSDDGGSDPGARAELHESFALACVALHEHLPPRQRTVLVMREALNLSAAEIAVSLHTTTASVNSALQRARATVAGRKPDRLALAAPRGRQ
ncbi:MAG TPA: sigma-70 family RNA polymerase sigma factor [Baekduia sp.]|nr:sigma-70 family RNA polymerase sigma factor [Baekduia sp.]